MRVSTVRVTLLAGDDMKGLNFIYRLTREHKDIKRLKPHEILIFNVSGTYGNYQVKIGPKDGEGSRPIEINGMVHHLFINERHVEPVPTQDEIKNNLKGTVIMNEVSIHMIDSKGEGKSIVLSRQKAYSARARKFINLAGENGDKMIFDFESNHQLVDETYRIVQEDILKNIR
jgi:hypothetical protein